MTARHATFMRQNVLALLALLALFTQGLIPAGMMPDLSPHRAGFKLTICTGAGLHTIVADAGRYDPAQPAPDKAPHDKMPDCPYAAFASLLSLTGHAPALILFAPLASVPVLAYASPTPSRRFFGNSAPRAPPV